MRPSVTTYAADREDSAVSGTYQVEDDNHGFFAKGRDFDYTAKELELLNSFESIEYLPPNNQVFREYLATARPSSQRQRWLAMGLIGFCVGMVGFMNKAIIEEISSWRKEVLLAAIANGSVPEECEEDSDVDPVAPGYPCGYSAKSGLLFPVFAGLSLAFAGAAAAIVVLIQPAAASSGIPEVIAFLNGTHQRKIFSLKTLVIKFFSCVLAVGSGLPVGPEGPMIHMGAMIGRGVSQMKSLTLGCAVPLFEGFRNEKDARDFLTAGAAAGVASAFGAPVGGLLFALEEVASSWSQTLTWQIFFCSMSATATTVIFMSAFGGFEYSPPFGQFHASGRRPAIEFYVADGIDVNILMFIPTIFIGLTCGVLGSAFTILNLKLAKFRRRRIAPEPVLRILEPMVIMLILASLTVLLTLAWDCKDTADAHPDVIKDGKLIRLTCPAGQYNELATLMINSGHHAVALLFTRHDTTGAGRYMFSAGAVCVFLIVYFVLAAWSAGSAISTGLVVPMLLIGACVGRMYGSLFLAMVPHGDLYCCKEPDVNVATWLTVCDPDNKPHQCYFSYVDPGAFALVGAAAFFGGVSRLTIALTIIMIEITNDVRFLLPIMLGVMIAKWVADSLTHSLYHAIIEAKCLPFLNPEVTLHGAADGDLERFTIQNLLDLDKGGRPSAVHCLTAGRETYGSIAKLLQRTNHGCYPLVDEAGRFTGTVTRNHLLAATCGVWRWDGQHWKTHVGRLSHRELLEIAEELNHDRLLVATRLEKTADDVELASTPVELGAYVNASAVSLRADFSLHRAYMIFRTMGLRHLVVTNVANEVVGIITRKDLMDFKLHEVLHPHDHHGHGHGHGHGHVGHGRPVSIEHVGGEL